jgi:hypothetical protein
MLLTINFLEGFNNDIARLIVDGKEVFSGALTTRMQISMAHKLEVETNNIYVKIKLMITNKNLQKSITVDVSRSHHIAFSIVGDAIKLIQKNEPFNFI